MRLPIPCVPQTGRGLFGRSLEVGDEQPEAGAKGACAPARRVPDARRIEDRLCEPSHGDDAARRRELGEERSAGHDFSRRRPPVRRPVVRAMRMRRDDVPQERPLRQPQLLERALDDRRRRLGRSAPRELPLGGERDPGQKSAAVAGSLADEEDVRVTASFEVRGEPLAKERRTRAVGVLIEGGPDPGAGEPLDEVDRG
jgi:hypothetical protein